MLPSSTVQKTELKYPRIGCEKNKGYYSRTIQIFFLDYELEKILLICIILHDEAIFIHPSYADFGYW
jgi:hypothetical protein